MIAVLFGARFDVLKVRTCAGLGHGDCANEFAACHFRQPLLLLLLGAVVEDVGRDDRIMERNAETVGTDVPERFGNDGFMCEAATCTAVLLRHGSAQQTGSARLFPCSAVNHLVLLVFVI